MIQKSHLGAYGVILHNDKILMVKKSRGPYKGKFDLPGGKVEFGESIEEALNREIQEETNLVVDTCSFLSTESTTLEYVNGTGKHIHFHHLGIIYTVIIQAKHRPLKVEPDNHDSLGAVWVNIKNIDIDRLAPFPINALKRLYLLA